MSTLRFNTWQNTAGTEAATAQTVTNAEDLTPIQEHDFASFGSTTTFTISNTTPVKIPFDATLYASTNMSWAYSSAVGSLAAYNWIHSKTGYYKLSFFTRTTNDVWHVMSVCTGDDYTSAVGTGPRMGSSGGAWGYSTEIVYKVTNTSDHFSLYSWSHSAGNAQSAFSGTPPTGFIAPTQDGASAPANGYFATFNIVSLSALEGN